MPVFNCEVLTPNRRFFSGPVSAVTLTTEDGEIQFLAGHEPLVAPVHVGVLKLAGPDFHRVAAVTEGFVRLARGRVDIFVDAAEWPEEIDRDRAERALGRAFKRISAETQDWLIASSKHAVARAYNRMKVAGLA